MYRMMTKPPIPLIYTFSRSISQKWKSYYVAMVDTSRRKKNVNPKSASIQNEVFTSDM